MLCGIAPLKFTVFGTELVTSKVPAVIVNKLATPNTAFADRVSLVPLTTVLNKLAVPLKDELAVNVAVPAVADMLPSTIRPDEIEKLVLATTLPVTFNDTNDAVPAPLIVFAAPLILMMVLAAPVNVLAAFTIVRLPVKVSELFAVILPLPFMVRLSIEILLPLIVAGLPVMVTVPPDAWTNEPEPVVARFPLNVILSFEKVIPDAVMVKLLKF